MSCYCRCLMLPCFLQSMDFRTSPDLPAVDPIAYLPNLILIINLFAALVSKSSGPWFIYFVMSSHNTNLLFLFFKKNCRRESEKTKRENFG